MNQNQPEKVLSFENHPIHLFTIHGKTAFLASEIALILGVERPSISLGASRTLEKGIDYDIVSTSNLLEGAREGVKCKNFLQMNAQYQTILYESGLFLFIIRSNKPIAVPFTRWVIREAIPLALKQTRIKNIEYSSQQILKLIELSGKRGATGQYAQAELVKAGFSKLDSDNPNQLTLSQEGANV